jgi:hypothetical protein
VTCRELVPCTCIYKKYRQHLSPPECYNFYIKCEHLICYSVNITQQVHVTNSLFCIMLLTSKWPTYAPQQKSNLECAQLLNVTCWIPWQHRQKSNLKCPTLLNKAPRLTYNSNPQLKATSVIQTQLFLFSDATLCHKPWFSFGHSDFTLSSRLLLNVQYEHKIPSKYNHQELNLYEVTDEQSTTIFTKFIPYF